MTKTDLYVEILPKLVDYLKEVNIITDNEKNSIDEQIELIHYYEAASNAMSLPSATKFQKIIKMIRDSLEDTEEISNTLQVGHYQVPDDNKEKLMKFSYKCDTLAVMPVKTIICEVEDTKKSDLDNTCIKIIELILLAYKDNMDELHYVWECFHGKHEDDYFLMTKEPNPSGSEWRLYSYAYFCYVNEKRFERPKILDFDKTTQFSTNIPYDCRNKYEQYFDVYNTMSESKYSEDVLSRYLRMYQILEYMAYRRVLADMTKGNIKENGFVRNVINKANRGLNNEFEELKKGLKDVLPDLSGIIVQEDITSDMQSFIKDRLMIKNTNHDNAKLWEVAYQLRNSIVHNKESELHFMYTNTKVYEPGIELMKLFISKIEPEIIKVINDPNKDQLEFTEQKIRVY